MNNPILINQADRELEARYHEHFNITNPGEYEHYEVNYNIKRHEDFLKFFENELIFFTNLKKKNIKDFIKIKLCKKNINFTKIKLAKLLKNKAENNQGENLFEFNQKIGVDGKVKTLHKIDKSLKNVYKTNEKIVNNYYYTN